MRTILVLLALAVCAPLAAVAQAPADTSALPAPGAKVRVYEPGGARTGGTFWYLRADTMHFYSIAERDSSLVALTPAHRVEVSRGRRRETWSAFGAVAGVVVGAVAGQFAHSGQGDGSAQQISNSVLGGAAGLLVGGFTGWFAAPEKWRPVDLPRDHTSVAAANDR